MSTDLYFVPFPGLWQWECSEHCVSECHRTREAAQAARELHEIAAHDTAVVVGAS